MNVSAPSSPLVLLAAHSATAAPLVVPRNASARGTDLATGKPLPTSPHDGATVTAPVTPAAPPPTDRDFALPEARSSSDATDSDATDSPTLDFSTMLNGLDAAAGDIPKPGLLVSLHPGSTGQLLAFHPAPGIGSGPGRNTGSSHLPAAILPLAKGRTPTLTAQAAAPSGLRPSGAAPQSERPPAGTATPQQPRPDPPAAESQPLTLVGASPASASAASVVMLPEAAHISLPPSPAPAQAQVSTPPGLPSRAADQPQALPPAQPAVSAPPLSPDASDDASRASAHPAPVTENKGCDKALETAAPPESASAPASPAPSSNPQTGEIAFGARLVARATGQAFTDPAARPAPPAPQAPAADTPAPAPVPESPSASVEGMSDPATANLSSASPRSEPISGAGTAGAADSRTGRPADPESPLSNAGQPNPAPAAGGSHVDTPVAGYVPPQTPAPPPQASASPAMPAHDAVTDPGAAPVLRGPASAPPDMPASGAARNIALRLNSDDQSAVEVRLSDRAGEVHVAVRSADPQMTESMRAHLPELVDRLGARGFDTEIWRPQPAAAAERGGFNSHSDGHGGRQGEEGQPHGGSRQKRDQSQPEWPEWMEELAASFHDPASAGQSTNL